MGMWPPRDTHINTHEQCTHMHRHMHTPYMQTCAFLDMHIHAHTDMHTCPYMYAQTHAHMDMHTQSQEP